MKKKILLMLALCMFLVGCSNTTIDESNANVDDLAETNPELKEPVLEWAEVYNPNGFNTVTGVLSNPNKVDIDVTYDLVYLKNGTEVARNEGFFTNQISQKHNAIVWGNYDIPNPIDVDEVKLDNVTVSKAYYDSIDAKIEFDRLDGNQAYFKVTHDKKPTLDSIYFLLYNDNNGNKKCDKGEVVVTSTDSSTEVEDEVCFDTDVFAYTDYEIYYNAY